MNVGILRAEYYTRIAAARRASRVIQVWIGLSIFLGAAVSVSYSVQALRVLTGLESGDFWPAAVQVAISLAVLALLTLAVIRSHQALRAAMTIHLTDKVTELSAEGRSVVLNLLDPICREFGVDADRFAIVRPKAGRSTTPSVVEARDGRIVLVVPLDFLTLAAARPVIASAMLAHEVGHVVQRDTSLWLRVSLFAVNYVRALLPLAAVSSLVMLGSALLLASRTSDTDLLLEYVPLITFALSPLASLWLLFDVIRRSRRRSEQLADLAAMIATAPHGNVLPECFKTVPAPVSASAGNEDDLLGFGFFGAPLRGLLTMAIHPSAAQRIEHAESLAGLATKGRKRFRLGSVIPWPPVVVLAACVLALTVGAVPKFIRAKEESRFQTCKGNLKQLEAAKEQYAMENRLSSTDSVALSDLVGPFIKNRPTCPNGGSYTLGTVGEQPRCSVHGELPY